MPALAARALDLDQLVEKAIDARRDELLELVRRRVYQTVDEFVAEVHADLGTRENSNATPASSKRCTGCGEEFTLDRFPPDKRRPDGRGSRCRACRNGERRRPQTPTVSRGELGSRPFAGSREGTLREVTVALT